MKKLTPASYLAIVLGVIATVFILAFGYVRYEHENLLAENRALKEQAPEIIEKEVPIEVKAESPFNTPEIISVADVIIKLQPKTTPFVAKFMAMHILRESEAKKLDPDLIVAQYWVESEFNPNALSKMGAIGLSQVRYEVWKKTPQLKDNGVDAKHKLYWIDANIQSGTDILALFISEANGDVPKALYRYYCGSQVLEKGKAPWQHEYIAKVFYFYFKIREHRLNGVPLEVEEIAAAPVVELPAKTK